MTSTETRTAWEAGSGRVTANVHLPFAQPWFRQALRLQIEQRMQTGDYRALISLSHVL